MKKNIIISLLLFTAGAHLSGQQNYYWSAGKKTVFNRGRKQVCCKIIVIRIVASDKKRFAKKQQNTLY